MLTLYYLMKKAKKEPNLDIYEYYNKLNLNINSGLAKKLKCRVCLQEGSIPITSNEDSSLLLEALQTISEIKIDEDEDDEHPKYLCIMCHKFLLTAILFRKIAKRSREIIKQQPVKKERTFDNNEHDDDQYYSDSSVYDTKSPKEKWTKPSESPVKKEKTIILKYKPKVTCNICNKVINRSYYKEHMTMHDPDHKKYICDVCGKSFRLRCAYHNHSLRHRNDFPYKCQLCPYKARYAELLKTHLRTHSGDYRYMCTECPARFLFKSNLNTHMMKHKEPQFKCEACKRAFHTKLLAQRHYEADHLGIKNHVCNLCGKAFGYRNAMMKHQRHVHKREKLLFGRMPSYLAVEHRNQESDLNLS